MQKIAIIGTVGLPANYGGFETLSEHIVKNLGKEYRFTVYCSGKKYPAARRLKNYLGAQLRYLPFDANGVQSIIYDSLSILHALFYADALLVLGVAGAWLFPFIKLFTNKKIIVSIDGIEWKRDKWNFAAKFYLWWVEKMAVKFSHIDISDNESIQNYTAIRYGSLSRIIEYGADHCSAVAKTKEVCEKFPFLNAPYAIKVCRIEPENNIQMVLEAFSKFKHQTLVIIGNWNNSDYGKNLRAKFKFFENIIMLDAIYDQTLLNMLRSNASLYIHGHSAGGTNPSLVEAMFMGLPVLAYDVSYNRTTTENKAFYFKTIHDIHNGVMQLQGEKQKQLAAVMKEIAGRRYTWKVIASKYRLLIAEVMQTVGKKSVTAKSAKLDSRVLLNYELSHLKYQKLFYEKD
ncbi:MAG: DUF1972 domain-containing protein [Bacteroidia bacterium]|nr:DUF1972 domain-containing protein [Bacteroidia bacterium]